MTRKERQQSGSMMQETSAGPRQMSRVCGMIPAEEIQIRMHAVALDENPF